MIVAKPVVDKNYWILTKDDSKIGAITADNNGYVVNIRGYQRQFKTLRTLKQQLEISLDSPPRRVNAADARSVHGFDAGCRAHNAMWHVQHRLPVFTKTAKSRSWYAAGWYAVRQNRSWRIVKNPKLILLQRYQFQGPFHTREEAHDQSIS